MTLSPVESRDVRGVPATKYRTFGECSHPDCVETSGLEKHHIFRRSAIAGDSYFVSIDGGDPIPHVVDLCREHHRQVTDNEVWIKLREDGSFCWWSEDGYADDRTKLWVDFGSLDPQPLWALKRAEKKQPKPKTEKAERRPSQVLSIRCPKDAADVYGEDGIALLKDLIARCGALMPHRDAESPPYFVVMDALGWFVLNYADTNDF